MNNKNVLLVFLTVSITSAFVNYATSCQHYDETIIAQCEDLNCDGFIYIDEIKSFGTCARRPVVVVPPKWSGSIIEMAKPVIVDELLKGGFSKDKALYELVVRKGLLSTLSHASKTQETIDKFGNEITSYGNFIKFSKLEETSLQSVEQQWKTKQRNKLISDFFWKIADWLYLIVPTVLLLFSIDWFNQWINRTKSK
jgi:hypothetical protein